MWLKRQNEKKLLLRSKLKEYKKVRSSSNIYVNRTYESYSTKKNRYEFKVPLQFSLLTNPNETINFFNDMIGLLNNNRKHGFNVFIDSSSITSMTIDALIYLIAIINNLRSVYRRKIIITGNAPIDKDINHMFAESGFYNYVKSVSALPLNKNSNAIQIISGKNSDTNVAKQMSDFVSSKFGISRKEASYIYIMMIELMSNTFKHAYNDRKFISNRWYCFCKYSSSENKISFTFMDIGSGIPTTVRRNFAEKLDILKLIGEHKYVISALEGKFRTSTELQYRGKGLPKIYETCQSEKIVNMCLVTNKAVVKYDGTKLVGYELPTPLCGTLYYWELLKGDSL